MREKLLHSQVVLAAALSTDITIIIIRLIITTITTTITPNIIQFRRIPLNTICIRTTKRRRPNLGFSFACPELCQIKRKSTSPTTWWKGIPGKERWEIHSCLELRTHYQSKLFYTQVRFTGFRDRPLLERQGKFIQSLREGHTEIVSSSRSHKPTHSLQKNR